MLNRDRLARAVVRLRSERPADWRDELDALDTSLDTGRRVGGRSLVGRSRRLKYASISELSALVVLLEERPTGERATFHDAVWRRIALRRRLRLTNDSCYGKPVNAACRCGEEGLDALTDGELQPMTLMEARARVKELAKERHQRAPQPRKLRPKGGCAVPVRLRVEGASTRPPKDRADAPQARAEDSAQTPRACRPT